MPPLSTVSGFIEATNSRTYSLTGLVTMSSGTPNWTILPASMMAMRRADLQRLVEIVADEDDGLLQRALQLDQLVLQMLADQRVERRERLVHQQDAGVGGEGARQADALLHAAAELVGELVGELVEPHELQLLVDGLVPRPPCRRRGCRGRSRHCRARSATASARTAGTPWRCGCGAAGAGSAASQLATSMSRRSVMDDDAAARDLVEAVDAAQQRGFAGAGQAHQHQDLALVDEDRGVVHGDEVAGLVLDGVAPLALVEQRQRLLRRRRRRSRRHARNATAVHRAAHSLSVRLRQLAAAPARGCFMMRSSSDRDDRRSRVRLRRRCAMLTGRARG